MLFEIVSISTIVRLRTLIPLVKGMDFVIVQTHINTLFGKIFRMLMFIPTVGRLIQDDSMFRFIRLVGVCDICHILRPFDLDVVKIVHLPFDNYI